MLIRQARPEDADAVAAAIVAAEGEMILFFTGVSDPEKAANVLKKFVLSPTPSRYSLENNLVAVLDGRAVGAAMSFPADSQATLDLPILEAVRARRIALDRLAPEGEPGTWYVSTMGIDPACRGRGIGSALLQASIEKGKAAGYEKSSLLVARDKPRVRELYERLGFTKLTDVVIGDTTYSRMIK